MHEPDFGMDAPYEHQDLGMNQQPGDVQDVEPAEQLGTMAAAAARKADKQPRRRTSTHHNLRRSLLKRKSLAGALACGCAVLARSRAKGPASQLHGV